MTDEQVTCSGCKAFYYIADSLIEFKHNHAWTTCPECGWHAIIDGTDAALMKRGRQLIEAIPIP